jgi:hypothetical protein
MTTIVKKNIKEKYTIFYGSEIRGVSEYYK